MKLAAIKAQMGIWRYYVTAMKYEDLAMVSPISTELSNSESYSNLLQRALNEINVESIKNYIITQEERFFNAIILAIYDGNPEWFELDVNVEEYHTFSVGVLEFKGDEIIFPVDGQHRVEGIKKALQEKPELSSEKVPVIFLGHQNTIDGKRRTRRLFSTLNRRSKRVADNELVALDEDDVVAIITRELAERHALFSGERMIDQKNKSISPKNEVAFTSILTLYEVNKILFKDLFVSKGNSKSKLETFLLFRPEDEIVNMYYEEINEFWNQMVDIVPILNDYMKCDISQGGKKEYRSSEGGNLLFRPIALSQFVSAVLEYKHRKNITTEKAISILSRIPMIIQNKPWKNFLWLEERKNINGRIKKEELKLLMLFMADYSVINEKEEKRLIQYVLDMRDLTKDQYDEVKKELINYSQINGDGSSYV